MSQKNSHFLNTTRVHFIAAIGSIWVYYLPYLILGENSRLAIHDNLDSNLSWAKVLLDSNMLFSAPSALVEQVFNGIPRSALYGNYDISLLWFSLFGMYGGYVINKIIIAMVAFAGMYYLLKKHILPKATKPWIFFGVALLFSLLPFWSFSLSVGGLPLVTYALLNIRSGNLKLMNWVILVVFAFYSSLVLSGIFFITVMGLVYIYDLYRFKKWNFWFLTGIGFLCFSYVLSHYPLFYSFLFGSDFVSHRTSFDLRPWTLTESLEKLDEIFRFGQFHAHSLHTYMLLPIIGVFLIKLKSRTLGKKYGVFLLFIALTSVFYGMIRWEGVSTFMNALTAIVPLQFQRFHFLHPMVWYVLLGLALATLSRYGKPGKISVIVVLLFQLYYIVKQHEFFTIAEGPSFKEFYAEDQFSEIKSFINERPEDYRVISIGIHPAIAQFNGFYTLDGYYPNYPLSHKLEFRKVISGELKKDNYLTYYYDNWGSRCYAFTQTLRRNHLTPRPREIKKLDFNFAALKQMGGKYLLSSAPIDTGYAKDLKLLKVFEQPESYWRIYLYRNEAL